MLRNVLYWSQFLPNFFGSENLGDIMLNLPNCDRVPTTNLKLGLPIDIRTAGVSSQIERLAPASLAYIGDAVYELYMRSRYLLPPKKIKDFHEKVVARVRAEAQASDLQKLEPYLSETEKDLLRRGRNGAGTIPKRLSPQIYQQATALETLLGYLYLTNGDRLQELLDKLDRSENI